MANLRAARNKKAGGPLARLKQRKAENSSNGVVEPAPKISVLAKLRADKQASATAVDDFRDNLGRLYSNPVVLGETKHGRPYGTVDISAGDKPLNRKRFTFHNRNSCWFYDVPGKPGYMKEPNPVVDTNRNLTERFNLELRRQGIRTVAEKRVAAAIKEAEKQKRLRGLEARRRAKKEAMKAAREKSTAAQS